MYACFALKRVIGKVLWWFSGDEEEEIMDMLAWVITTSIVLSLLAVGIWLGRELIMPVRYALGAMKRTVCIGIATIKYVGEMVSSPFRSGGRHS